MINAGRIEENFKNIYTLIEKMPSAEKEILSDKLLAFLLFQTVRETDPVSTREVKKTGKKKNVMSKKDKELIKKIVDKTDELYKRLGGDSI